MRLTVEGEQMFFDGQLVVAADVTRVLASLLGESRKKRIEDVLQHRSMTVATVVEGSVNTGNVSAVMRTAEACGFLPFHVIRTGERFKNSARSSQGSDKWLDLHYWDDTGSCLRRLKETGYHIVATVPSADAQSIGEIDFSKKTAIVLGNEAEGISQSVFEHADSVCRIPMVGFVESFNISVAAALCLFQAFQNRGELESGDLSVREKDIWRAIYFYRSVRRPDEILARGLAE